MSAPDAFSYSQERVANRWRLRQYLVNHAEVLATTAPMDPSDVVATWPATLNLQIQSQGTPGLRRPQYGAVHSLLGYWTTDPKLPATVVMPTGTGKTDTMVAALVAHRVPRLLVIVPSDALRDQLAQKFETLGVLPELGLVDDTVARPVVGRLFGRIEDTGDASTLAKACNVVVTTPQALNNSSPEVWSMFLSEFSHLFVDEAHHVAAPTWQKIRDEFSPRPVVQFTATPHRQDGQHLGGNLVYVFPLREAQREGYFSTIRYQSVLSLIDPDRAIAKAAVGFLREDLSNDKDHILMARAKGVRRAEGVLALYRELAPEFKPVLIHSGLAKRIQTAMLTQIKTRDSRILVCVDMFGEGFDLPQLKIAALHDPHRSLGITLQFVGRFARSGDSRLGAASVVAARSEVRHDESLRRLYAEDADWNQIIEDLSAEAVDEQQAIDEFTKAFNTLPDEVSIHSLAPALSTVVYRPSSVAWHPERIVDAVGRANLVTYPVPVNNRDGVAWFVTRTMTAPRWGDVAGGVALGYDLYVIYWDATRGLLYINSSNNDSVHEDLAQVIMGEAELSPVSGESVYRVFDGVHRLTPNNVGLLDARNRNRRYTSYVGTDVTEALPASQKQTKTQTHIAGTGFLEGARYSIAASLKGRIWSHRTADGLKPWTDWCDVIGRKIVDDTISVDDIMAGFIRPVDIEVWPALRVLGLELSADLAELLEEADFDAKGTSVPYHEIEFRIAGQPNKSHLPIEVVSPDWTVPYQLVLERSGLAVRPESPTKDVVIKRPRSETQLSQLLTRRGVRILLEADSIVEPPGVLLRPNRELPPFDASRLQGITWDGVNIHKESWGDGHDPSTVQGFMIGRVLEEEWDIVIDDDGSGEVADIVCLRMIEGTLLMRLIHCKYSHADKPGSRVDDLYEVAGQAQRSASWRRDIEAMFMRLIRRERTRAKKDRTGFVRGDIERLHTFYELSPNLVPHLQITIAQPGLSASRASASQLELLSSVDTYLADTALSQLEVICSK